jgi:pimeloyl-ACP methyl ester carboxylesterase
VSALRLVTSAIAVAALGAGCASQPRVDYAATPPQQLAVLGTPAPEDGRARFRQIFCALYDAEPTARQDELPCDGVLHRLAGERTLAPAPPPPRDERLRVLIVTSALGECIADVATPFDQGAERLEPLGYRVDTVVVGGMSSSAYNAAMIADAVAALELAPDDRLVLVGYSKGAPDILHFLVGYPELAKRVAAAVSVAGAVNGSPLADGFSGLFSRWLAKPSTLFCEGRDLGMVNSLRRGTLLPWLAAHPLPAHVQTFSLAAFTDRRHVARLLRFPYDLLSTVDPRNDGQVIWSDQLVPGSTLLGYANADHWAVAMALEERRSFWMSHPGRTAAFPRAALFEAIVLFVGESLAADGEPAAR